MPTLPLNCVSFKGSGIDVMIFESVGFAHASKNHGVADFRYEFFLKGARRAPFKKNSYPDPPMPNHYQRGVQSSRTTHCFCGAVGCLRGRFKSLTAGIKTTSIPLKSPRWRAAALVKRGTFKPVPPLKKGARGDHSVLKNTANHF